MPAQERPSNSINHYLYRHEGEQHIATLSKWPTLNRANRHQKGLSVFRSNVRPVNEGCRWFDTTMMSKRNLKTENKCQAE